MVHIHEGDEPVKVPLVYYDENGEKHIVGEAAVQIKNGEVIALGQIQNNDIDMSLGGVNLEGFSISNPADKHYVLPDIDPAQYQATPADISARRLGPLSLQSKVHVTDTNPDGSVSQCPRLDLHAPHEWPSPDGGYFNRFCEGNVGSER